MMNHSHTMTPNPLPYCDVCNAPHSLITWFDLHQQVFPHLDFCPYCYSLGADYHHQLVEHLFDFGIWQRVDFLAQYGLVPSDPRLYQNSEWDFSTFFIADFHGPQNAQPTFNLFEGLSVDDISLYDAYTENESQ